MCEQIQEFTNKNKYYNIKNCNLKCTISVQNFTQNIHQVKKKRDKMNEKCPKRTQLFKKTFQKGFGEIQGGSSKFGLNRNLKTQSTKRPVE